MRSYIAVKEKKYRPESLTIRHTLPAKGVTHVEIKRGGADNDLQKRSRVVVVFG